MLGCLRSPALREGAKLLEEILLHLTVNNGWISHCSQNSPIRIWHLGNAIGRLKTAVSRQRCASITRSNRRTPTSSMVFHHCIVNKEGQSRCLALGVTWNRQFTSTRQKSEGIHGTLCLKPAVCLSLPYHLLYYLTFFIVSFCFPPDLHNTSRPISVLPTCVTD